MMIRMLMTAFVCVLVVPVSLGQSSDSDSQILREILAELRGIHQDMQVTETTQLLVAELEMQQSVVNRATESADEARAKLNDVRLEQKHLSAELPALQDHLEKSSSADEKSALSNEIERQKSNLEELKNVERDRTTTLQQMEQRLQTAQDKLAGIEDELSAAVSRLGPPSKDAVRK